MENPYDRILADYELAIGADADYYLPRFAAYDAGGSHRGWNWPAFFATSPWFVYRRMWVPGLLNLFYPFVLCFVAGIAAAFLVDRISAHPVLFAAVFFLLLAAPWFLLPMYANSIYWRHVRRLIDKIPLLERQADDRFVHLARHGGTSVRGLIGVLAVVVVAFLGTIGMFVAIAIPAYHDYSIRAQITEGLNLAGEPKAAVAEYYARNGDWPDDAAAAGVSAISGKYVESLTVQEGSVVIVYGREANPVIGGRTLILMPGVNNAQDVIWTCANGEVAGVVKYARGLHGTDLPDKYLPFLCRAESRAE